MSRIFSSRHWFVDGNKCVWSYRRHGLVCTDGSGERPIPVFRTDDCRSIAQVSQAFLLAMAELQLNSFLSGRRTVFPWWTRFGLLWACWGLGRLRATMVSDSSKNISSGSLFDDYDILHIDWNYTMYGSKFPFFKRIGTLSASQNVFTARKNGTLYSFWNPRFCNNENIPINHSQKYFQTLIQHKNILFTANCFLMMPYAPSVSKKWIIILS